MIALLALFLQTQDPLDRLISKLKGPSRPRRAAAEAAIRAFGESAAARLAKEGLDPALARGVPAAGAEDGDIRRMLRTKRLTIDMQNVPLTAILNHVQQACGVRIEIDRASVPDPENEQISFKVSDIVVDGALRLMLGPRQKKYLVQGGILFVTGADVPAVVGPGRAPVRIVGASSAAPALAAALGSEGVAERDRAQDELQRLGFAAEGALWDALDSMDAEVQGRVEALLRRLYTPRPSRSIPPLEAKLQAAPFQGVGEEEEIRIHLDRFGRATGVPLVFDAQRTDPSAKVPPVTWPGPASDALSHFLAPLKLKVVWLEGVGLITDEGAPFGRSRWEGPAWLPFDEARAMERHLADLASSDAARQTKAAAELARLGPPALEPLLQASRLLEPAAAARCREAAARIDFWLVDQPSGADLQALTEAQRKILRGTVSPKATEIAWKDVLTAIATTAGGKAAVRAEIDRKITLNLDPAPLGPLLKALTRPYGLDFHMEGECVVIDTVENVRAAVRKEDR